MNHVDILYVDFEDQRDIFLKLWFVAHRRSQCRGLLQETLKQPHSCYTYRLLITNPKQNAVRLHNPNYICDLFTTCFLTDDTFLEKAFSVREFCAVSIRKAAIKLPHRKPCRLTFPWY